jgi:hypothetical protein
MYQLTVCGEVPANKAALTRMIKLMPEQCELSWRQRVLVDPEQAWEGPLLKAGVGTYNLWQEPQAIVVPMYMVQLMITPLGVLLDGQVVVDPRFLTLTVKARYLAPNVLTAFQELLAQSQKRVFVYENSHGQREYMLRWPDDVPPPTHPTKVGYQLWGSVNLNNGQIV